MTTFIESPRFPVDISYGSSGGPGFRTLVFSGHGSYEQRDIAWDVAKARYNVGYGIRDTSDMNIVRAFFYEMRGRAIGFRYKDWSDYTLTDENIGTGDGADATWQIIKTYGATNPYVRTIKKIVAGTLSVKVNGSTVALGGGSSQVSANLNTGILTFGASVIPALGHAITVTCEFDVPVRFDTDQMSAAHEAFQTENWGDIPLVEIDP
jgi:uncharacterized protein (TIGR02217 family)